jgi:cytochrome P450
MRQTSHSVTSELGETSALSLMAELATPAGQADPYPIYHRLRELGDIVTGPDDSLIVTGYRHCSALLREPRLRKNPGRLLTVSGFPDWEQRPALRLMFKSMLMMNPPEHTRVRGLVDDWSTVLEILNPPAVDRADAAASAIIDYFHRLAALRRAKPQDDLVSALVKAADGEEPGLTDEQVVSTAALILAAGFETTTGLLANGLVALLDHPAQADRLRREPALAKAAVEELLRYDTPVQMTLILDRDEGVPLSFGAGIHHCLGAALARLEGQVMVPKVLRRFPNLELAGEPEHRRGLAIHGYRAMPVTLA